MRLGKCGGKWQPFRLRERGRLKKAADGKGNRDQELLSSNAQGVTHDNGGGSSGVAGTSASMGSASSGRSASSGSAGMAQSGAGAAAAGAAPLGMLAQSQGVAPNMQGDKA